MFIFQETFLPLPDFRSLATAFTLEVYVLAMEKVDLQQSALAKVNTNGFYIGSVLAVSEKVDLSTKLRLHGTCGLWQCQTSS